MPKNQEAPSMFQKLFWWMAGCGIDVVSKLEGFEKSRITAQGMCLITPVCMAGMGAAYVASSIVDEHFPKWGIVAIAVLFAYFILVIDRQILCSYRYNLPPLKKFFVLLRRIITAAVTAVIVSHPLTLLIFEDSAIAATEKRWNENVAKQSDEIYEKQAKIDSLVAIQQENLSSLQSQLTNSLSFSVPGINQDSEQKESGYEAKISALSIEIEKLTAQSNGLKLEIADWQNRVDSEVAGENGKRGYGSRAKNLEAELNNRQLSLGTITESISSLTKQKTTLMTLASDPDPARRAMLEARIKAELANMESIIRGQGAIRASIEQQIATATSRLDDYKLQISGLNDSRDKLRSSKTPTDLIAMTQGLHDSFEENPMGFWIYLALTVFLLILDILPVLNKLGAGQSIYDKYISEIETNYISPQVSRAAGVDFDQNPIVVARELSALLDEFKTQADLADAIGCQPTLISKYLRLLKTEPDFQESVGKASIALEQAYQIATLNCSDGHRMKMLQVCIQNRFSQSDLKSAINKFYQIQKAA